MSKLRFRLLPNNPTIIKLNQVFDLMEKLGISFELAGPSVLIHDKDKNEKYSNLYMESIDDKDNAISVFPPDLDYEIFGDDAEFERLQEEENKNNQLKAEEEKKAQELLKLEKEKIKKEQELEKQKARELEEFKRIKEKYNL